MATIFDTVELVKQFSNQLGPGAGAAGSFDGEVQKRAAAMRAARGVAPPPAVSSVPPASAAPGMGAGIKSTLGKVAPKLGLLGTFMSMMSSGDAGAGSDVIADASTGEALPRAGTALSPDMVRRAELPTNGAGLSPLQVSSVRSAVDETQAATQAQADAKAQAFTDARTARVNQVVAESQAAREQEAKPAAGVSERAERMQALNDAIAETQGQLPDQALYSGGFAALPALFAQTNRYVSQRGALNRLQKQEFESQQKELDRESAQSIGAAKILADFRKSMKPDFKVGSLESTTGKQPVVIDGLTGRMVSTATMDAKGNVTSAPVQSRPTAAQAQAQAQARIDASKNKVQAKALENKQLKELGYPPIP